MIRLRNFPEKSFSAWTKEEDASDRATVNAVLNLQDPLQWAYRNFPKYKEDKLTEYALAERPDYNDIIATLDILQRCIEQSIDAENLILRLQGLDAAPGPCLDMVIHWTYVAQTCMRYDMGHEDIESHADYYETSRFTIRFLSRYRNKVVDLFNQFRYACWSESPYSDGTDNTVQGTFQSQDEKSRQIMQNAYDKTWLTYLEVRQGQ